LFIFFFKFIMEAASLHSKEVEEVVNGPERNEEVVTEHVAKRVRVESSASIIPAENRRILDLLDFTLLDHDATPSQLEQFCCIANESIPAAVCVFSEHVQFVKTLIDSRISVAAVAAGFPVGSADIEEIKSSVLAAVDAGADEIDWNE
jgi:hypothetical protein